MPSKPPFATDEPDSFYESPPVTQRRVRQPRPINPNDRSSAYDVYSNYLDDSDQTASRQSGVGALGLGLLNMDEDEDDDNDDDDDDDDDSYKPKPQPSASTVSPSKHAALAAATAAAKSGQHTNVPVHQIAAPQPGYPAPIAALNNLSHPEPAASLQTRAPLVSPLSSQSDLRNPFADPRPSREHHHQQQQQPPYNLTTSPSPSLVSNEPHPLQAPITPITPVFARPAKAAIKFSDAAIARDHSKPIMRGNSEETLLPNRGEKGDDFWRRFSIVAKEENKKPSEQKISPWLRKTQDGSTRLSRWVWIIGLIILVIIGGSIGIGWYVSHKAPDHQQPTAFGGSANEAAPTTPTTTVGLAGSTIRHVSATHTLDRRTPHPTPAPWRNHSKQRRHHRL